MNNESNHALMLMSFTLKEIQESKKIFEKTISIMWINFSRIKFIVLKNKINYICNNINDGIDEFSKLSQLILSYEKIISSIVAPQQRIVRDKQHIEQIRQLPMPYSQMLELYKIDFSKIEEEWENSNTLIYRISMIHQAFEARSNSIRKIFKKQNSEQRIIERVIFLKEELCQQKNGKIIGSVNTLMIQLKETFQKMDGLGHMQDIEKFRNCLLEIDSLYTNIKNNVRSLKGKLEVVLQELVRYCQ